MVNKWHATIAKYIDHYWKPLASFVLLTLSALAGLEKAGVSPTTIFGDSASLKPWLFVGFFITLFIVIRFRRVAYWLHWVLFPRSELRNENRIFRGPEPFGPGDEKWLKGRRADSEVCIRRIKAAQFFVLEGESGCGKSSLLEAAVVPALEELYRVINCRVAGDPFGKVSAAIRGESYQIRKDPVGRKALVTAVNEATTVQGSAVDGDQRKPLLVCIDQFEELFFTVPNTVRDEFAACLRQLITVGKIRLLISIRSDFSDLLIQFCRSADPKLQLLSLRNSYTLKPFLADQAEDVIIDLLKPLYGDDPVRKQETEDFAKELVTELLRSPVDPRLSAEDEKSVLPVELQTVGMMLESNGIQNLAPGAFHRLGGKVGILKAYIEDVKAYVWRQAGVSGQQGMLILRELISPAHTKLAVMPIAVANRLGLSPQQVEKALDAFAEKYLVKRLPPEGLAEDSGTVKPRYELLHEHWVQVLAEAPDPTLQRAQEAEESLRFWLRRTSSVFDERATPRSVLVRVRHWFAHPIPFGETLRLWQYARSPDSRRMLQRTIRGYILTTALAILAAGLPVATYTQWTRSDSYQIDRIVADAPVEQADASLGSHIVEIWVQTLARMGREEPVLEVARKTNKPLLQVIAFIARAEAVQATSAQAAEPEWDKARVATVAIENIKERDEGYQLLANAFRRWNKPEKAREVEGQITPSLDPNERARHQIVSRLETCLEKGLVDEALEIVQTGLEFNGSYVFDDSITQIVDSYLRAGKLDEACSAISLIRFSPRKVSVQVKLAKWYANAGNAQEANKAWDEAIRLSDEYLGDCDAELMILVGNALQETNNAAKLNVVREKRLKLNCPPIQPNVPVAVANFGDISGGLLLARVVDLRMMPYMRDLYSSSRGPRWYFSEGLRSYLEGSAVQLVAAQAAVTGKTDEARKTIAKLEEPLKSIGFLGLAVGLHGAGKHSQALEELQNVHDDSLSSPRLAVKARVLVSLDRAKEATADLSQVKDDTLRSETIKRLAKQLAQTDQFDAVVDVARRIDEKGPRCEALSALAESLVEVGKSNTSENLFCEAADTASQIPQEREQSSKLALVAQAMARSKYFRLARQIANRCGSVNDRLECYVEILSAYGK